MFKNSKFAPTPEINEMLAKIESKKKNFGKKYDINSLRNNIVENYSKILAGARKQFAAEAVKPDLKLKVR